MKLWLIIMAVSTIVLVFLIWLFRVEERRGVRFLEHIRSSFDDVVEYLSKKILRFSRYVGTGVFQSTFHYLIHNVLGLAISVLAKVKDHLARLQMRNKKVAKVAKHKSQSSHLDEIASYKEEHALSEEEKRQRRLH